MIHIIYVQLFLFQNIHNFIFNFFSLYLIIISKEDIKKLIKKNIISNFFKTNIETKVVP